MTIRVLAAVIFSWMVVNSGNLVASAFSAETKKTLTFKIDRNIVEIMLDLLDEEGCALRSLLNLTVPTEESDRVEEGGDVELLDSRSQLLALVEELSRDLASASSSTEIIHRETFKNFYFPGSALSALFALPALTNSILSLVTSPEKTLLVFATSFLAFGLIASAICCAKIYQYTNATSNEDFAASAISSDRWAMAVAFLSAISSGLYIGDAATYPDHSVFSGVAGGMVPIWCIATAVCIYLSESVSGKTIVSSTAVRDAFSRRLQEVLPGSTVRNGYYTASYLLAGEQSEITVLSYEVSASDIAGPKLMLSSDNPAMVDFLGKLEAKLNEALKYSVDN